MVGSLLGNLVLFFCLAGASSPSQAPTPTPQAVVSTPELPKPDYFWRAKPELFRQIREERKIVVSANEEKAQGREILRVVAAGHVKVELASAQKMVTNFEKLREVDDRFQEVKYFPDRDRLFVHLAVYGFHTQMLLQLWRKSQAESFDLQFESIEGGFRGMKGVIHLEDFQRHATEISMTAYYESAKLPLPSSLMGVGLEIVASKVAGNMRNYLEKWKP